MYIIYLKIKGWSWVMEMNKILGLTPNPEGNSIGVSQVNKENEISFKQKWIGEDLGEVKE
jgi:hypothetical protein